MESINKSKKLLLSQGCRAFFFSRCSRVWREGKRKWFAPADDGCCALHYLSISANRSIIAFRFYDALSTTVMAGVDHCAFRRNGTLKALSSGSRSSTLFIFWQPQLHFPMCHGEGSARRGFCKDGPQSCTNGGGRIGAASQARAPKGKGVKIQGIPWHAVEIY